MMFQGRSVISAVWGIVPAPTSRQMASPPVWSVLRLFRRQVQQRPLAPRLPVASASPNQRIEPPA